MEISVINGNSNSVLARSEGESQVVLTFKGEYTDGDFITFSGLSSGQFYIIKVDSTIEAALVFVKQESIKYAIPFEEKKRSYNRLAFCGDIHYISIRNAFSFEVSSYRNLALNPFDQHEPSGAFPHASANVETRGESVFAARNAIDGYIATSSHGEWPYESWGINRQDDAELKIDFGRAVDINQIGLYTRADFPHDNWWTEATFDFSDGSSDTVHMDKKSGEPHIFNIEKEGITWIKLGKLIKADDPSPFPALTQIEVYGTESRIDSDTAHQLCSS